MSAEMRAALEVEIKVLIDKRTAEGEGVPLEWLVSESVARHGALFEKEIRSTVDEVVRRLCGLSPISTTATPEELIKRGNELKEQAEELLRFKAARQAARANASVTEGAE